MNIIQIHCEKIYIKIVWNVVYEAHLYLCYASVRLLYNDRTRTNVTLWKRITFLLLQPDISLYYRKTSCNCMFQTFCHAAFCRIKYSKRALHIWINRLPMNCEIGSLVVRPICQDDVTRAATQWNVHIYDMCVTITKCSAVRLAPLLQHLFISSRWRWPAIHSLLMTFHTHIGLQSPTKNCDVSNLW